MDRAHTSYDDDEMPLAEQISLVADILDSFLDENAFPQIWQPHIRDAAVLLDRLTLLLDASKRLLSSSGRVKYGYSSDHDCKGYFLFDENGKNGEWAGTTWSQVIAAEAAKETNDEQAETTR